MNQAATTTSLPELLPIDFGNPDQLVKSLNDRYAHLPPATDEATRKALTVAIGEFTAARSAIEAKRKQLKAGALEYGRALDAEAGRWTDIITQAEAVLRDKRQPYDDQKKAEKEAKEAEERRIKEEADRLERENLEQQRLANEAKERELREREAALERAEQDRKDREAALLRAEQARKEAEAKAEKEKADREKFERQAEARAKAAAEAEVQRQLAAEQDRKDRDAKAAKEAEEKRQRAEAEAKRLAPDADKLAEFAAALLDIAYPQVADAALVLMLDEVRRAINSQAFMIQNKVKEIKGA